MRNRHPEQLAIEFGGPEVEEVFEFREARREIVFLPDVALQQSRIIRQVVEDLCRGEAEALQLGAKIGVAGGLHISIVACFGHWQSPLIGTLRALPSLDQNVR